MDERRFHVVAALVLVGACWLPFASSACGGRLTDGPPAVVPPPVCVGTSMLGAACAPPQRRPVYCPALCGNGVVDECAMSPPPDPSEQCDGADLSGASCLSSGYVGGTMTCDSSCYLDGRGCDACERDHASPCTSTLPYASNVPLYGYDVDAVDGRVGVAWVEGVGPFDGGASVRFAVLASDLTTIVVSDCLGNGKAAGVAVAATPAGWLLAVQLSDHLDVYALDDCGAPRRDPQRIDGANLRLFASRTMGGKAVGGPLMVVAANGLVSASLLDADGESEGVTVALDAATYDVVYGGIFVGDAFVVASGSRDGGGVDVSYLSLDGALAPVYRSVLPVDAIGVGVSFAMLGPNLYALANGYWVEVDRARGAVGAATKIDQYGPLIAFPSWIGVVEGKASPLPALTVVPIVGTNQASFGILSGPTGVVASVSDGEGPVVLFTGPDHQLGIARIRP